MLAVLAEEALTLEPGVGIGGPQGPGPTLSLQQVVESNLSEAHH